MTTEKFTIPIFPLPDLVLFSGTFQPLHIFEERYRRMITDILDERGWIGMALLREGWQNDYYGRPAFHNTIGVGEIGTHQVTEDGRFYLVLQGIGRAKVLEMNDEKTYRLAKCCFDKIETNFNPNEIDLILPHLSKLIRAFESQLATRVPMNYFDYPQSNQFERMVNTLITACIKEPEEKLRYLNMRTLDSRVLELAKSQTFHALKDEILKLRPDGV